MSFLAETLRYCYKRNEPVSSRVVKKSMYCVRVYVTESVPMQYAIQVMLVRSKSVIAVIEDKQASFLRPVINTTIQKRVDIRRVEIIIGMFVLGLL